MNQEPTKRRKVFGILFPLLSSLLLSSYLVFFLGTLLGGSFWALEPLFMMAMAFPVLATVGEILLVFDAYPKGEKKRHLWWIDIVASALIYLLFYLMSLTNSVALLLLGGGSLFLLRLVFFAVVSFLYRFKKPHEKKKKLGKEAKYLHLPLFVYFLLFNGLLLGSFLFYRFGEVPFRLESHQGLPWLFGFLLLLLSALASLVFLLLAFHKIMKESRHKVIYRILFHVLESVFAFSVIVYSIEGGFCYYPSSYSQYAYSFGQYGNVTLVKKRVKGSECSALYQDNGKEEVTLFFGGNGMSALDGLPDQEELASVENNILAVDYPYFGSSQGRLTEERVFAEAESFYFYLLQEKGYRPDQITVAGFSIGTGAATYLASKVQAKKLVLAAPYDNFTAVLNNYFPVFYPPLSLFVDYKYKSDEYASQVRCPVTIVYSLSDTTVRPERTEKLIGAFSTKPKVKVLSKPRHNGVLLSSSFTQASGMGKGREMQ